MVFILFKYVLLVKFLLVLGDFNSAFTVSTDGNKKVSINIDVMPR